MIHFEKLWESLSEASTELPDWIFRKLFENISESDIFDTLGLYGRSFKDTIDELLQSRREIEALYMKYVGEPNSEQMQQEFMAELGMPESDFQEYLENRRMGDIDNAAREIGMSYEDLDDWIADNWDRPVGEERWDRLSNASKVEEAEEVKSFSVWYKDPEQAQLVKMKHDFRAFTSQDAEKAARELLDKEAPGNEFEIAKSELVEFNV